MKQKFNIGDHVMINKVLPPMKSHFICDREAIVLGSYYEQYGGGSRENKNEDQYTLFIKDHGEVSWYQDSNLSLLEENRTDLLKQWKEEIESLKNMKSDLDWIFKNGKEVVKNPNSYSIEGLSKCFGSINLWGLRGEGMTYRLNAMALLEMAKPYLLSNDKEGWLKFAIDCKKH